MTTSIDRRRLFAITGSAAALTVLPTRMTIARGVTDDTAEAPLLGSGTAAFDRTFGDGTPLETGLIQYDADGGGTATYAVRFTDDVADLIEVDLTAAEGGAVPAVDAAVGESRFLPEDADLLAAFRGGDTGGGRSYDLAVYASASLSASTGRSGNALVLDREITPADGPNAVLGYVAASVAMEALDVWDVTPGDSPAVIGDTFSDWYDAYGRGGAAQRTMLLENPPVPDLGINGYVGRDTVPEEVDPDQERVAQATAGGYGAGALPVGDAFESIGAILPADAELEMTFLTIPDGDRIDLRRVQIWLSPALDNRIALIFDINGSEETGEVYGMTALLQLPPAGL